MIIFLFIIFIITTKFHNFSKTEFILIYALILVWSLHFLQVLVPESGFDALWYHLPVIKQISIHEKIIYIPEIYQTVNPLFSDLYFLTGYSTLGIFGAKIIAYVFGVFFIIMSYKLARIFLDERFSLVTVLIISLFQVTTWQSSSFYIDVSKAFFELAGLFFILSYMKKNKYQLIGLLFFSASLATKLFSLLLLPLFIFSYGIKNFFSNKLLLKITLLLAMPIIYYSFAYINTGHPFYSFYYHLEKLAEIGGIQNPYKYLFNRIITLPKSVLFFIIARDYVFPPLSLVLIYILLKFKKIFVDKKLQLLLIFSLYQWIIWWIVPPLSTRYALSGFVTLLILGLSVLLQNFNQHKQKLFAVLVIFAIIMILPRIIVANRSLKYILGVQTQKHYLQQFYDGSIDEKINNWYGY